MGVESTYYITRSYAIERITTIAKLFLDKNWKELEEETSENDFSNEDIVSKYSFKELITYLDVEKLSDSMLEDIIDKPFFRKSLYENYFITETGERPD